MQLDTAGAGFMSACELVNLGLPAVKLAGVWEENDKVIETIVIL